MRKILKPIALLSIMLFIFACNKEVAIIQELQEEALVTLDGETFVSVSKATDIAAAFLGTLSNDPATKSNTRLASTETIRSSKNSEPLMYVMNYAEGGFVIVSATKKYVPILAYAEKGNLVISENIPPALSMWICG